MLTFLTALAARTGISRGAIVLLVALAFFAVAALGAWRAVVAFDAALDRSAETAREARDKHWEAEIAKANAEAERRTAEQLRVAMAADAKLRDETMRLQSDLKTLEERNAALAGGDRCGLERDRVRLLDAPR